MFNKALLMAVGGKKKANVPTNGTLHTRISFTCDFNEEQNSVGMAEGGYDESVEKNITVLEGPGITARVNDHAGKPFNYGLFNQFIDDLTMCTTTLPMQEIDRVCAVVREDTGAIIYGIYGTYEGIMTGLLDPICTMMLFSDQYEVAKQSAENWDNIPLEYVQFLTQDDVGKEITFSIYLCD